MTQSWREPRRCAECAEFDASKRPTLSGIEPAGWCVQCHGPVRPEAPACVLFEVCEWCNTCKHEENPPRTIIESETTVDGELTVRASLITCSIDEWNTNGGAWQVLTDEQRRACPYWEARG